MKKLLIILFAILIMTGQVLATTYYVDPASTTGDGSVGDPWGTLAEAEAECPTGTHTISIAAGTYAEDVLINNTANITWLAGGAVTLKNATAQGITIYATAGTQTFSGVTITGNNAASEPVINVSNWAGTIYFTGCTFTIDKANTRYPIYVAGNKTLGATKIYIDECTFNVTDGSQYLMAICFRNTVAGALLSVTNSTVVINKSSAYRGFFTMGTGSSDVTILDSLTFTGNIVTASSNPERYYYFFSTYSGSTNTIGTITLGNNIFTRSVEPAYQDDPCFYIYHRFTTCNVYNNIVYPYSGTGIEIVGLSTGATTDIYNNVVDTKYTGTGGHGIGVGTDNPAGFNGYVTSDIHNNKIIGHGFYDSSSSNAQHGILIGGGATGSKIRHNSVNGAGLGIVVKGSATVNNPIYVLGNEIINTVNNYALIFKGAKNNYAYNNTIYNDASHSCDTGYIAITTNTDVSPNVTSTGNTVKNNIVYGDYQKYFIYIDSAANATGFTSGYNLYYDPEYTASSTSYFYNGTAAVTLASFGTTFSDTTSSEDNPDFVDPAAYNLTLRYDSPAINTGTDLGDAYDDALHPLSDFSDPDTIFTADQDNFGSGWEIGAYVYVPAGLH